MSQKIFELDQQFDPQHCRHSLGGLRTVQHNYHLTNLLTQVVIAMEGERHLYHAAECSFYQVLNTYFTQKNISSLADKLGITEQYWRTVGMGSLHFIHTDLPVLRVEMTHSHVDKGWLKAKGLYNKPINFITAGFIAACAALLVGKPVGSYEVSEIESIVMGSEKSVFEATEKGNNHGN